MPAMPQTQPNPEIGRRKVEVLFDPSRISADPFSIAPERVELDCGRDTDVEFILKTLPGRPGCKATFPASQFILWQEGVEADAPEAALDPDQTRGRLRFAAHDDGDEPRRYPYHVRAEYDGELYVSAGYPDIEDPPPAC